MIAVDKFVEIKLPRHILYLTQRELELLLAKDLSLWETGIRRGKAFQRAEQRKIRVQKKLDNEKDRE